MDRIQGISQCVGVDTQLRPAELETRLRFIDAILDGFHRVAAGHRSPRASPVGFQYDVCIDQHYTLTPSHDASQIDCTLDVMCSEEIYEILDALVEQTGNTSHRDAAPLDRKSEHLHEGFREQGGRDVLGDVWPVVA